MKSLFFLAAGATLLTAVPVEARHHHSSMTCVKSRHGHCVAYARTHMVRPVRYRTGYVFGPSYSYTTFDTLPSRYVTRYHLSPDYRYVYNGGTIYVVDPKTYAVERIINAIVH